MLWREQRTKGPELKRFRVETADRHWVFARAWLRRDMDAGWAGEEK
jgi:hypothetical protein